MQAILFDLDGTLLDTLDDLASSMNAVLTARGLPLHDNESYKYFVGDGVENLVLRSLPKELRREPMLSECIAEMRAEYSRRWNHSSRPYQGIPELLAALTSRGMSTAVLSNKPQPMTDLCVTNLLAGHNFAAVRGARPGVAKKPDPAAALEIASEVGVAPANWLYVGDTATDMKTAVAAGMRPIGVLWGFRDAAELCDGGAESLIARPSELLELL